MRKFAITFAGAIWFLLNGMYSAYATCVAGSVNITFVEVVSGDIYDPLDGTDADITFRVTVQNTGPSRCNLYFAACLATATPELDPSPEITYGLARRPALQDIMNTSTATCPASGVGLTKNNGNVQSGQTKNFNNFRMTITAGQFITAVTHSETDPIELGIYSRQNPNRNALLDTAPLSLAIDVAQACEMTATPATNLGSNATYTTAGGLSGGTINFDGAISTLDATVDTGSMTLGFTGSRCNYQAFVSVSSANGGMTQQSGASAIAGSGAFLSRVDYTARAEFCGTNAEITTAGVPGISDNAQCTNTGLNETDLNLIVSTANGSTPLLSGDYEDTLTVQIGAAL